MKGKDRVETALKQLLGGGLIVVTDDARRENEGDLIGAAELISADQVNFCITHGRGLFCQAITAERAASLNLPLMAQQNNSAYSTAFTVSVDARSCTTGISAAERAITTRVIADPNSSADDLLRPGHCFPIIAAAGKLRERQGHTEAVVSLMELAGLQPSGVLCEILAADGSMSRGRQLQLFAQQHQLPLLEIGELLDYLAIKALVLQS